MWTLWARALRLGQDERGTIALVFALGLSVIMGMMAMSVDAARAYRAASMMAGALDAAALAAGTLLDDPEMTDSDIQSQAVAYFNANWRPLEGVTMNAPSVMIDRAKFEVHIAADRPYGFIEAVVQRDDAPPPPATWGSW